jgi:hypothetical protein
MNTKGVVADSDVRITARAHQQQTRAAVSEREDGWIAGIVANGRHRNIQEFSDLLVYVLQSQRRARAQRKSERLRPLVI